MLILVQILHFRIAVSIEEMGGGGRHRAATAPFGTRALRLGTGVQVVLVKSTRIPWREIDLIAYDGGIVTQRGVEMVATSPLFRGLPVHLLMSGKESQSAPKQLEWAKTTLEAAGFEVTASLIPGDAESVIAKAVREQGINMLIMGAYSHSPLRSLLFGSKTSDLLRSAKIPTLLLR